MSSLNLPNELNLPPHLSAHKYFLVCTLTVAAWDTLVLSPRTWRLLRMPGWPVLKILFHFLRVWMPAEFVIVAVAFFDTKWSQSQCQSFYLFEPIATAVLLAATSAVHVIRIHAISDDKAKRPVLTLMSALYAIQIAATAVACAVSSVAICSATWARRASARAIRSCTVGGKAAPRPISMRKRL